MRVGIVCPYSLAVPGGVQFHVRDLAVHLRARGHDVAVLAPADDDADLPDYVTSAGRSMPVPYNGSVARLTFGPVTAARVGRWVEEGRFDVLHLHEPLVPSVSLLALWAATGPVVATFHTSLERSRALQAASPVVRASVERIHGRIAVSAAARETVVTHIGADAVVVPNGVDVGRFARIGAAVRAGLAPGGGAGAGAGDRPAADGAGAVAFVEPAGSRPPARAVEPGHVGGARRPASSSTGPTLVFLGRIDEPRKGLAVLLRALPTILAGAPGARLLVAGFGDVAAARASLAPEVAGAVRFLGPVGEDEKAALLAAADVFVAPHTGGESFGIVLAEAMSAGAPVVASDLPAFADVLDGGRVGRLCAREDPAALAAAVLDVLRDAPGRAAMAQRASAWVRRYDWGSVTDEVLAAYEAVTSAYTLAPPEPPRRGAPWRAPRRGRLLGGARPGARAASAARPGRRR